MGKRKCKVCGSLFDPRGANYFYCSDLCRKTACFVGGGGDTSKPNSDLGKKPERRPLTFGKMDRADYPRVEAMFKLPVKDRWEFARDFTPEEREMARRLSRKELIEDKVLINLSSWNGELEVDDTESDNEESFDILGESDDGSI